ncbi:type II toxin-antitoxin system RelE/ParE family toxin [Methylocella sp.]|uniref:type II toxin-antitoxin system RelE family toxin n=1 Tax=Methylocella sp. TaxID=1978226 RepID=UPI0035B30564
MKTVSLTRSAAADLRAHRADAKRIVAKIERYAQTGAGDATQLVGSSAWRLRVGDYRVIFEPTETEIVVTKIAPRGEVYR